MNFESELNKEQYQAVTSSSQYLRIIAGAGSGKTRVLTYRLAYLIGEKNVDPKTIVAIAFTNKVANEMKERAIQLLGVDSSLVSVSTFHSYCAKFLRKEIHNLDIPNNFTIIDEEDQKQIIKSIAVEFGFRKKDDIVKIATKYIALNKEKGVYPQDIDVKTLDKDQNILDAYKFFVRYEEIKTNCFALDFDDLLLYTIKILKEFPNIREKHRKSITNILIDEFQDTNNVQFELVELLMNEECSLYVVGDPDQTIYSWRGANQDIILNFTKKFPLAETIILNQNYRSTNEILSTANALIKKNKNRVPKDLYTTIEGGEKVTTFTSFTKEKEAEFVIKEIKKINTFSFGERKPTIAILYRASYLTLPFERCLIENNINYAIYGGVKFFERKEIKDVLAFLRLTNNKKDDISFERIINIPRRGIGERSFADLKQYTYEHNISMYEYIENAYVQDAILKPNQMSLLKLLINELEALKNELATVNEDTVVNTIEKFFTNISYTEYLKEDDSERLQNVTTLLNDIREYLKKNSDRTIYDYLEDVALTSAQDEIDDEAKVLLMTIHVAKGLEFDYVFVVGLVEGIFPSDRTLEEYGNAGLEEERRLCYVAFTRAKKKLYVTTNTSFSFVLNGQSIPSRFIKEADLMLPKKPSNSNIFFSSEKTGNLFKEYFANKKSSKIVFEDIVDDFKQYDDNGIYDWQVGETCYHTKFGRGTVQNANLDGTIIVEFDEVGRKTLLGSHPTLSRKRRDN